MSEMARGILCGCEGDDVSTRLVPLHCLTTKIDMGVFERLWVEGWMGFDRRAVYYLIKMYSEGYFFLQ